MQAEKHLTWAAAQDDDRMTLRLSGELSRDTLLPLWQELRQAGQRSSFLSPEQLVAQNIEWDLSQVSRIDSAGFALLCDLIHFCRQTQQSGKTLVITHVPSQLLTLADLVGLSDWIAPFIKN
ncbi:lipid asymmetry maintenance protein MlaB [Pasteurellaceae bacterium LIM206]|nr:lipid asymmetry maintenance protein MlaB [Pasteurellaceae bacterium LIM206]